MQIVLLFEVFPLHSQWIAVYVEAVDVAVQLSFAELIEAILLPTDTGLLGEEQRLSMRGHAAFGKLLADCESFTFLGRAVLLALIGHAD